MRLSNPKDYLKLALVILGSIILLVVGIYSLNFHNQNFSDSAENWGQFGDYIGGLLNPIFSFFSLIALLLTILVQTRQLKISTRELKLSRQELRLTRDELKKSAIAQNESQLALNKQAEIANKTSELGTINFLILRYEEELKDVEKIFTASAQTRKAVLINKRNVLKKIIEETYDELIEKREKSQ